MVVNATLLDLDLNLLKPNIIKTWEKPWLNYQPQSLNFSTPEYNYDNKLKSVLDTAIDLLKSPVSTDLKKKTSIWGKVGGFLNQAFDYGSDALINGIFEPTDNLSLGMANIFSSGLSSVGDTVFNNIVKGELFSNGLTENAGQAVKGAALGLGTSLVGLGITSAMGDSKLGRFTGTATSTALGDLIGRGASGINPYGFAMNVVGRGFSAALGPSKEYNGRYGNITKAADSVYDAVNGLAYSVPGGQVLAGALSLNKGLSNLFGSTDGMCVCAGTKIFTASGDIINIEDLLLEQGIIGWDENSHNILPNTIAGIIEPRLKECLEIELKNGTILRCSIDHPILSNIKEKAESHRINGKRIAYREWSFRRADELQVGNWIGLANNIDYWGTEEMPNAYLVGMLIGDGTYTYESSCKLWTADPSTWKYLEENNLAVLIKQYTPENSNGKYSIENRDYRIINGMQLVKNLGIAYLKGQEKTLPKNIGKYNKDSICKLIAGLYDTDGSFSVNEEKGDYKITLYQSNLELLENLKLILQKLGIFATIYARKASINKMSNGRIINSNQSYRLELTDRNSIINFYKNIPLNIDYKKEHLEKIYKLVFPKLDKDHCDLSGAKQYKIVSIKHIGILTVYNLEASETHTYLANGIITHNTRTDAILGSAFMPASLKWLNMLGASTTDTFNNQSWQNAEKVNNFMQNAFGDLGDKFNKAREEAGKTYGTFSRGEYNEAQDNIRFANSTWGQVLAMADLNELLNIRSALMTSINNQRYALNIQGGWNPMAIGKQGMKILNNATNHNMGMRLLSAAALIDDKQMILSFLLGGVPRYLKRKKPSGEAKKFRAMSEEELRNRKPEIVVSHRTTPKTAEELNAEWERTHPNGGNADPNLSRVYDLTPELFNQTAKPPFTGQEYSEAVEAQRQKKIEKFHEVEKIGEATLMADLAVSAAPLLLRGFRWAFNKAGLLIKVPKSSIKIVPENAANVTPEQWTAAQDAAIARGDMAEAQRLRGLHFKINAPNTKVVDGTGNPQLVIHKTPNDFTVFDNNRSIGKVNWAATPKAFEGEDGVFATGAGPNPKEMRLYVNMKNPHYPTIDEGMEPGFINKGEDGILGIVDRDRTNFYKSASDAGEGFDMSLGVDNPYALKSADAVTYDNNGVRIPLGSRDNFNINDIRYYESPNKEAMKGVKYIEQAPSATSLDAEQQLVQRLESYTPKVGENGLIKYKPLNNSDVINIPEEAIEKQIQRFVDSGITREDAIEHLREQFGYGAMTQNGKTFLLPEKYMITNPEYMKAHDAIHRVLRFDDSFNIPGAEGLNPNEAVAMISGEIKPALGIQANEPLTEEMLNKWLKITNNKITGRYGFSSKIKDKKKFLEWVNKVAPVMLGGTTVATLYNKSK